MSELGMIDSEQPWANPLTRQLDESEAKLLEVIWRPVAHSQEFYKLGPAWPTWDFVSRTLLLENPGYPDPNEVLRQLPAIARRGPHTQRYSLVFRSVSGDADPGLDEIMGLTVAGLYQLARTQPVVADVADTLATFIRDIAKAEQTLPALPDGVADTTLPLADIGFYINWFEQAVPARSSGIPRHVIAQVLQREFAPINAYPSGESSNVTLRGLGLLEYREIDGAADYLDLVATHDPAREVGRRVSPLTLVQTIDYFAYVLSAHPRWNLEKRFVQAPDLQSAAALGFPVVSREDFESRVTSLWNLISRFQIPPIPDGLVTSSSQQSSINQMHYWLEQHVGDPLPDRALFAIHQIRAVGTVRQSTAHGSLETRAKARLDQARLGLPDSILDWTGAWETLQLNLAGAFEVLREEVQASSPTIP
jgi:hypothetical protein